MTDVDEVVLVTGSSKGIGRSTAVNFSQSGMTVAIHHRGSPVEATEVAAEIRRSGGRCEIFQADLSAEHEAKRLRREIEATLGHVSILVNNAGEILRPGDWLSQSESSIRATFDTNLLSVIWACRTFAPPMVDRGFGRIVNLTTTYAVNGAAAVLAYTAAKAGVNCVTTALAAELASSGVLVNAVAPGNVDTEMTRSGGSELLDWTISTTPVGRLGSPDEVARAIVWLTQQSYVCGHVLNIDGGQLLKI